MGWNWLTHSWTLFFYYSIWKLQKTWRFSVLRGEEKESFCLKSVKISSAGYLSLFIMELLKVSHETYVEQTVESISISWIKRFIETWSRMCNMHLIMMNCFCGMVGRRKALSLISIWDHCPRFSPLQISDTSQTGFEPPQNLSSDFIEWSSTIVITFTPRRHYIPGALIIPN